MIQCFALYILQERAKAEKINRKLRQQLADFRVPEVMEYVTEKADLYELQKKVKSWERKVEIAEVKCLSNKNDIFDLTRTWCTMYQHELLLDSFWMVITVMWFWICIFFIFQMSLKTHRKTWNQMQMGSQMENQWRMMEAAM